MPKLTPVDRIPAFAVIIRCIYERGDSQREAFAELERRGLWLSAEQKRLSERSPEQLAAETGP